MLKLPTGVRLLSPIRPIPVKLDNRATVSFPIIPVFTGSLPADYIEGEHEFSPRIASVTGPSALLAELDSLETTPIDISGKTSPFIVYVRLRPKVHADRLSVEDILIRVAVSIAPVEGQRELSVPVTVLLPPGFAFLPASITPAEVTLVVRGPENRLRQLKASDISVTLDVGFLKVKGIHKELSTKVLLPAGFSLVGDPPRVEVLLN
jgi:YbbR domain-containing protein